MSSHCRQIPMSDVTDVQAWLNRRAFLSNAFKQGLLVSSGSALSFPVNAETNLAKSLTDKIHSTTYNNYYEFSSNKEAVAELSKALTIHPWSIQVDGMLTKPLTLSLDDFGKFATHNRVYRFRCVEGWSMVVPWTGILLKDLINLANPDANAKYLRFESLFRPAEMVGQRRPTFPWPYAEGLRLDEAMHPLTMLAFGMYGEALPKQNGGPIRLVVPWKYGFKSIKAITKIEFVAEQPLSSWSKISPKEYGFYANVNPDVAHPRWSQRRELPLGKLKKIRTLPFNGYAKEVASLYKGMDLVVNF